MPGIDDERNKVTFYGRSPVPYVRPPLLTYGPSGRPLNPNAPPVATYGPSNRPLGPPGPPVATFGPSNRPLGPPRDPALSWGLENIDQARVKDVIRRALSTGAGVGGEGMAIPSPALRLNVGGTPFGRMVPGQGGMQNPFPEVIRNAWMYDPGRAGRAVPAPAAPTKVVVPPVAPPRGKPYTPEEDAAAHARMQAKYGGRGIEAAPPAKYKPPKGWDLKEGEDTITRRYVDKEGVVHLEGRGIEELRKPDTGRSDRFLDALMSRPGFWRSAKQQALAAEIASKGDYEVPARERIRLEEKGLGYKGMEAETGRGTLDLARETANLRTGGSMADAAYKISHATGELVPYTNADGLTEYKLSPNPVNTMAILKAMREGKIGEAEKILGRSKGRSAFGGNDPFGMRK
jgi:hypothetical protein